ncbi:Hypothetical_protein [Hexamita inflata]|uniref:Hypothetical_protein n=1 Tax=Hexamita inflata TaxID=28002 RepID=A0AA86NI93_9EUKA|nr:Hypothetical protein HINF_LOCUS7208 [Hexamita inflata]
MSVPVEKFVSQIAAKLGLSAKQSNLNNHIVIAAMLLPDIGPLFSALSLELKHPKQLLVKFFFEFFVQKHLTTQQFRYSVSIQTSHEHKFKVTGQRAKPTSSTEFQHRFSTALKTVLNVDATDAELCQIANSYFLLNNQMKFWREIQKIIPEKNDKQHRDYFQKSFQSYMYTECISSEDKVVLCKLMDEMKTSKPSQIAVKFEELVGNGKYFKRNVVMYVVNRNVK